MKTLALSAALALVAGAVFAYPVPVVTCPAPQPPLFLLDGFAGFDTTTRWGVGFETATFGPLTVRF
jgi:hypothetical protein